MRGKQLLFSFLVFFASFSLTSCTNLPTPILEPMDQFTQAPAVKDVTSGAVVELWSGNTGGVPALLVTSPPLTATVARVVLPHRLPPGQIVRARQRSGFLKIRKSAFSDLVLVENNYVTNRYDNERSGWNPNESTLTLTNVRGNLGKVCEHEVGAPIRGQPLFVEKVDVPGKGKRNVVFVATDADQVWAFDADSCVPNDKGLWKDGSGIPGPRTLLGAGESVPGTNGVPAKCSLTYGIWSTPVIDRTTSTMYVVASVGKGINIVFRLHAIDIATGQDRVPPITIDGTTVQFTHGNSTATLDPSVQQNRPGLLLDRGVVYVAFGSCGDVAPYHGWVLAYDADIPGSSTFLKQLGVFNASSEQTGGCNTIYPPPRCMAGIWQSGLGLAADGDGTVYLLTGNGKFDSATGSYGNTLLRLRLPPAGSNTKQMQVVSFFTPPDWENTYDYLDQDLGAGGPVLFTDGSRRFILAGGKPPKGYLIDRDCTNCSGAPNWCNPQPGQTCPDPPLVLQTMTQPQGIVAGPAHYTGPNGKKIYYGYNYQPITAFKFQSNPPQLVNPQIALDQAPTTSPIPTVSSNGSSPGTGIVWAVFHPGSSDILTLHAYDAENVSDNLFGGSSQKSLDVASWASSGLGNSFQVPSVIHGKVYCGSKDRLVVFGVQRRPLCSFLVDCGGSVTFHCTKDPSFGALQLERKQNGVWKPVANPGSRDLPDFIDIWDYPSGDTVVYRLCSKEHAEDCTPEFAPQLSRLPCGIELQCGRNGSPPCFFYKPWPISPGELHRRTPGLVRTPLAR